ncbi:ChbG/HpnK family deacetylase [Providencia stuartii]|uniref:ChbG/HpnK family deacetylase n=1 Tax=Providencia stuartii TaxID=588 RepID=UPI00076B2A71|nr:ChbG/HpnK family deacetylase [Providencia stuartii]
MFIINADDYGISERVNNAIIHCFNHGLIHSTTLMANMPGTEHAIKNNNNFNIGCHLNLMEGKPLNSNCLNYHELCNHNDNSLFLNINRNSVFIKKHLKDQIFRELELQIVSLLDNNITLTHLDSHQHTHTIPAIYMIVHKLSEKYNLKVRLPRTTGSKNILKILYKKSLTSYMKINKKNFTDYFINYDEMNLFKNSNKLFEVMVHPDIKNDNIIFCNTTNLIIDKVTIK